MSERDSYTRPSPHRHRAALLGLLLAGITLSAVAGDHAPKQPLAPECDHPFSDNACRLSARELDGYRGGFSTGDGFDFSLGLTNLHQVNDGPLVAQTLLNLKHVVAGLKDGLPTAATSLATIASGPATIQVGPGSRIAPEIWNSAKGATGLPPTIIQNSLDGQHIKNARVFDLQLGNVRALTNARTARERGAMLKQSIIGTIR